MVGKDYKISLLLSLLSSITDVRRTEPRLLLPVDASGDDASLFLESFFESFGALVLLSLAAAAASAFSRFCLACSSRFAAAAFAFACLSLAAWL